MIPTTGGNRSEKHYMKNLLNNGISFQAADVAAGSLRQLMPELYELESVIENNPWHSSQNVFDHTVSVLSQLETIMQFDFLFKDSKEALSEYISTAINGYSVKEIAIIVALMHDIGKKATFTVNSGTGMTDCSDHGEVGANLTEAILQRLGVSKKTSAQISKLVRKHGDIHEVVNRILLYNEPEKEWTSFKKISRSLYILFILQGYADTAGSDLLKLNPKDYKKREIIYREAINRFAAAL